jgi:hypothetical protein
MIMAVELLPEALILSSGRAEQLRVLNQLGGLPSDAAACSIASNDPVPSTIQLLENARGIIWNRLLDEIADTDNLRKRSESLAEELEEIRRDLFQNPRVGNSLGTESVSLMVKDPVKLRGSQSIERYRGLLDKSTLRVDSRTFFVFQTASPTCSPWRSAVRSYTSILAASSQKSTAVMLS